MATAIRDDLDFVMREDRAPVRLWGRLEAPGEPPRDIVVNDLSTSGFCFETPTAVAVGAVVTVHVGGLPAMTATVRRDAVRGFGCELATPLDAATLDQVRRNGPFAAAPPAAAISAPILDPVVTRWPGWLRVSTVIGASIAGWAGTIALARIALG